MKRGQTFKVCRFVAAFMAVITITTLVFSSLVINVAAKTDERDWIPASEKEKVTDYAYSMAVVGDTQILAQWHRDAFTILYEWLLDNIRSKKIKFVIGLGDITDGDSDEEWELAQAYITRTLDGRVPYSLVRGNHDSSAQLNKYFPYEKYASNFAGVYEKGKIENAYQLLKVGNVKYLIMSLDYGASDAVLDWAGKVCDSHKDYNVIITTHAYLYHDGTTLDDTDLCPPSQSGGYNDGDDMWKKFVSKHENITLVLSGHDPENNIIRTQTEGDHGNIVTQMLIDPQGMDSEGPKGMVAMFYFSEDGSNLTVEYYSTYKEMFYAKENQFTIELATVTPSDSGEDTNNVTQPSTDTGSDTDTELVLSAGDVDGDGTITASDSDLLKKYLAGWDVEISKASSDMTEDGKVDIRDAVRLEQHLKNIG